ncbi:hypothetical protein HQQ80_16110 [Microbacteriaceae bacterium VKM Ac-2855]|nr:hypothetical protein [Microbacteriaceae bacterium VKM Ac-2855]
MNDSFGAPENGRPHATTTRRSIVGGVAWSVPVIAAAVAAPLAAASNNTCPVLTQRTGIRLQIQTSNLNSNGSCHSGSTVAVQVSANDTGVPALAVSSDTVGLTAAVSSLQLTVTFPYAVSWGSNPKNWTVTLLSTSGLNRTYAFTPGSKVVPTTISVGTPSTNWVRTSDASQGIQLPTFTGNAVYDRHNPFFTSDLRETRDYPWSSNRRYSVAIAGPCPDQSVVNTGTGVLTPVRTTTRSRFAASAAAPVDGTSFGGDEQ